ncbi:MAG: hypothetical protein AAGC96_12130 [Pseudomonadota bacterium]
MSHQSRSNLFLGVFFILFSLVLIFVWIPLDTDSGIVEKVRRQVTIGDALAPTIAGVFLLIGGAILVLFERRDTEETTLDRASVGFFLKVLALLVISMLIMRYAGPAAVAVAGAISDTPMEYRLLRDTAPWKYIGFFLGGTLMISGLIGLIEGRVTLRTLSIGVVATVVMIAIYDWPFDDLLLPPNGDV